MKIDKEFLERVRKVSEKEFCNLYFLKVDIFLIMHDPYLKLYICIQNIGVDVNVTDMHPRF